MVDQDNEYKYKYKYFFPENQRWKVSTPHPLKKSANRKSREFLLPPMDKNNTNRTV